MSRGPGALQRKILGELARAPTTQISWTLLKIIFPREATQRSLHRAVRGLVARGLVYDERVGGRRSIGLTVAGDTELLELFAAVNEQLRMIARIRSMEVPDIMVLPPPRTEPRPTGREVGT